MTPDTCDICNRETVMDLDDELIEDDGIYRCPQCNDRYLDLVDAGKL